jgi:hypothetical protein
MPKAKRIAAGEPTRSAPIDLALFTPPALELPRMKLPPLEEDVAIEWGDTTPERVIASFRKQYDWVDADEVDAAYAEFRQKAASATTSCAALMAVASNALLLELLTPTKSPMFVFWDEDDVDFFLARLGERAVKPLRAFHAARVVADAAMLRMRAPFVAKIAAANLAPYVSERVAHHEWLLAHAELATKALLHAVLTEADDIVRQDACEGLRFLATRDDGKLLRELAREWKVKDLDAIALPRLMPPKASKVPKAWGEIPLPSPDKKVTEKIIAFLASEPDAAHPWTKKVLAALDEASAAQRSEPRDGGARGAKSLEHGTALRAFVSAMYHAWTSHGSATTHTWLVHADALVFGDAGLRRAGAWARTKSTSSSRNERNRAGRTIEVLDRFASPVALAQIADAATLAKAEWLRTKADRAVRVRMLTSKEDLDDILERAMPDLGFGAGIVLDFGPRKFTAKARTDLSLVLVDDAGASLDDLPKPRKSDDAKLAKTAIESWRTLKTEVDGVAKVARGRLETAMRTGRSWTRAGFLAHVAGHPLMRMLAQGLVWGVRRDGALVTFRVAEDGSLADADDRAFDPPDAPITIVHPCELTNRERDAWTARLDEYEAMPPIDQLARVSFDVAPAQVVDTCNGWTISCGAIFGLLRDGWKAIYEDGATIGVKRSLGGDRRASVVFSPGIVLSEAAATDKMQLHALSLSDAFQAHARAKIDLSEVLRDLAGHHRNPSMTSKASS